MMLTKKINFLILMLISTLSFAEQADRTKPIQIAADFGSLDQQKEITVWRGNVVITQGSLRFTADEVIVNRVGDDQQHLIATGRPVTFQQKLDNKPQYIKGKGARVEYDSKDSIVILTGNAQVSRDGDVVNGNRITYNTHTEYYTVNRGPKQRVTVLLQPTTTQKKK